MVKAAQLGYQSILSNGYYIDLIQPTDTHYLNDPLPADSPLTLEQQKKILGGETTMWAEFVAPETVDSRIWPRTAAIAERFWSPREVNNVDDMYRRLEKISLRLEEHGLTHEKNRGMMLRRLAGGYETMALENLVNVIEPVKIYTRNEQRPHSSFSPLTRVVDVARPDATVARKFRKLIDRFIEAKVTADASQARMWLTLWRDNHQTLLPVIKASPALAEIESLSQDLSAISAIGLEVLAFVESGQKPSSEWKQEKLAVLDKARQPRGQAELVIVSAIEKLIKLASAQ
jgi:hexosaminidase